MYAFITGPLLWLSIAIFLIGLIVRVVLLVRLTRKKDKVVFDHLDFGWSFRSVLHRLVPFGNRAMRENPLFSLVSILFHFL